jgi:7-cyano-7-deazaguanine synthase
VSSVLLLSGGVDSAAVALLERPSVGLFVDYGQAAARAERRAAKQIQVAAAIEWAELAIDCTPIAPERYVGGSLDMSRWWPYRNQLIVTFGAAWAILEGADEILIGTVATDGEQHRDGTPWFVASLDDLLSGQEGGIRLRAPAIELTTEQLCRNAGTSRTYLAATYSCHIGSYPCGECGGCLKRADVLRGLFSEG